MKRMLVVLVLITVVAVAQQPPATSPPPAPATPTATPGQYLGVATCAGSGCHGATTPLNNSRVLQNEYYTWLHDDSHAGAYNVLFNALSARIVKNMRLRGKAYEERLCLDCHSTNVAANSVAGRIDPEDGIQCEACHGPASGWRAEHVEAGWTHEQSVARGMIDLRAIRIRATLCNSCHIGSRGKDVDHELIASGHPQLPFELDNYTATMPPHWKPNETHGARAWAVGQAVALRDALDNLARHARGDKWPEFSDMSCYNCHHALTDSAWRQARGWPSRAGLPAWSPQRWAVARIVIAKASPQTRAQLDDSIAHISARVARMNDPAGTAAAADEAKRQLDSVIPRIDALSWSERDVRAFMSEIAGERGQATAADIHAAEQTALALQSLAASLTRRTPRLANSPLMKSIDVLFAEVKDRDRYDPRRFSEKLGAVRAAL
jgi:hypothetical protein